MVAATVRYGVGGTRVASVNNRFASVSDRKAASWLLRRCGAGRAASIPDPVLVNQLTAVAQLKFALPFVILVSPAFPLNQVLDRIANLFVI